MKYKLACVEKVNPRAGQKVLTSWIGPAGSILPTPDVDDYFPHGRPKQEQGETKQTHGGRNLP
jgi:hypothetical protein